MLGRATGTAATGHVEVAATWALEQTDLAFCHAAEASGHGRSRALAYMWALGRAYGGRHPTLVAQLSQQHRRATILCMNGSGFGGYCA